MQFPIEITFDNAATPQEASTLALDLQQEIKKTTGETLALNKKDPNTLDFGASLILILGTPVAVEIIKAIRPTVSLATLQPIDYLC